MASGLENVFNRRVVFDYLGGVSVLVLVFEHLLIVSFQIGTDLLWADPLSFLVLFRHETGDAIGHVLCLAIYRLVRVHDVLSNLPFHVGLATRIEHLLHAISFEC